MEKNYQPYKVRRVEGFKCLYRVCRYGILNGVEVIPGFFESIKAAQEFADAMNTMHKEVQLHV